MDFSRLLSKGAEGLLRGTQMRRQNERQEEGDARQRALLNLRRQAAERAERGVDIRERGADLRERRFEDQEAEEAALEEQAKTADELLAKQLMEEAPERYPDIETARLAARSSRQFDHFDPMSGIEEEPDAYERARTANLNAQARTMMDDVESSEEQRLVQDLANNPTARGMMESVSNRVSAERVARFLSSEKGGGYPVDSGWVLKNAERFREQARSGGADVDPSSDPRAQAFVQEHGPQRALLILENTPDDELTLADYRLIRSLREQVGGGGGSGEAANDPYAGLR